MILKTSFLCTVMALTALAACRAHVASTNTSKVQATSLSGPFAPTLYQQPSSFIPFESWSSPRPFENLEEVIGFDTFDHEVRKKGTLYAGANEHLPKLQPYRQLLHRLQSPQYLGLYSLALYGPTSKPTAYKKEDGDIRTLKKFFYLEDGLVLLYYDHIRQSDAPTPNHPFHEHALYSLLEFDNADASFLAEQYENVTPAQAEQYRLLLLDTLKKELQTPSIYPSWAAERKLDFYHLLSIHQRFLNDAHNVRDFFVEKMGRTDLKNADPVVLHRIYKSFYEDSVDVKGEEKTNFIKQKILFSLIHKIDARTATDIVTENLSLRGPRENGMERSRQYVLSLKKQMVDELTAKLDTL